MKTLYTISFLVVKKIVLCDKAGVLYSQEQETD